MHPPKSEDIGEDYLNELVDRSLVQVESTRSDEGVKTCQVHDLLHDLCKSKSRDDKFLEVCTQHNFHTVSNPCRLSLLYCAQSYMSSINCDQSDAPSLFLFNKEYPNDALKYFQSIHVLYFETHPIHILDDLKTMIHLRYLRIHAGSRVAVPDFICSLWNLQVFDVQGFLMVVSHEIWKLKQLRHLFIRGNCLNPLAPKSGSKHEMWNLQTLGYVSMSPELTSMPLPNKQLQGLRYLTNLRTLKVAYPGSTLSSDETAFPPQLIKITLVKLVRFDSSLLKALGQLTNLKILKLKEYSTSTVSFDFTCADKEFPQLQVLHLDYVGVRSWRLVKGAMPCLGRVLIRCCEYLSELPEQLWSMTNLRQVHVRYPSTRLLNSLQNVELKNGCKLLISGAPPREFPESD